VAMKELKPRTRKVIELRELGDLSTRETARRMGLSAGAVKGRLFHGRRKLRKTLSRCRVCLRLRKTLVLYRTRALAGG
jgi:DNA-directed RNA polymerase specialized sigma24 family protein